MINIESLCPNCMTDKAGMDTCPNCKDEPRQQHGSLALPERSILHDRFVVGRVLGKPGGFGITYLVWDQVLETTAAIKEFLPSCSMSRAPGDTAVLPNSEQDQKIFKAGLNIFLREAKTLAQFTHPNIVRIRDYFSANNTAYLVMEYHQGIPFDQYIKDHGGRLTQDQALELMLPVLEGVAAVHKKGFLHRDIKPQNIYLTDQGIPLLLDFGSARYTIVDRTSSLTVMLSTGFAPFEQYHQKGKQGPWTDIYGCGATLYYMVTGQMPADAIERQHNDNLIPPKLLNPSLSESFSQAILKAMSVEHQSRPQRIQLFRTLLTGTTFSTEIPVNYSTQTANPNPRNSTLISQVPAPALLLPARRAAISYQPAKQPGLSRLWAAVFALLLLIVLLNWNSRQTPVEFRQIVAAPAMVPENDSGTLQAPPQQIVEWVEITPFQESTGDGSQFPQDEFLEQYPIVQPPLSNDQAIFQPPLPHRPPEHALKACQGKNLHTGCQFETPHGLVPGMCLPAEFQQLACFPEPPPFPNRNPPSAPKYNVRR